MGRIKMKLPEDRGPVVPNSTTFGPKRNTWAEAILAIIALVGYAAVTHFMLGPTQPAWFQRLLGLFCAALATSAYWLLTQKDVPTDELLYRAKLAQRSDFGKQQLEAQWAKQRSIVVRLPWLGEVGLRALGAVGVFVAAFVWWLTPLAPVRVQGLVLDDLTVPLAEQIVSSSLMAPNGRIALVAPPIVPARAQRMALQIPDGSNSYLLGLKAIAGGRSGEARAALNAAAADGRTDPVLVKVASAQNELYAGLSTDAARLFENALESKPDDPMLLLQTAVAWLRLGSCNKAEPHVLRALRAFQALPAKPAKKNASKDLEKKTDPAAYGRHVLAMLRILQGKSLDSTEKLCADARGLIAGADEASLSLLAAGLNNEAVLYLLLDKSPGAINRFDQAQYNWTKAFGPRSPAIVVASTNEVPALVLLGEYRKANEVLTNAEAICRENADATGPLVPAMQIGRALLAEAQGQYAEGLTRIEDAQAIVQKSLGSSDPLNVPILDVLASLDAGSGRFDKAISTCQQAVDLSRRIWGADHPFYVRMESRAKQLRAKRAEEKPTN